MALCRDGEERVLCNRPEYFAERKMPLRIARPDGSQLVCELRLPFDLPGRVSASKGMLRKDRHLAQGYQLLPQVKTHVARTSVESVLHLFRFDACGSVDDRFHTKPGAFGYHELCFLEASDGLWCRISLFGGLLGVRVRVSDHQHSLVLSFAKRIQTPWLTL
jgi:hypothetical protein